MKEIVTADIPVREFATSLGQSLLSLSFSLGGILTGILMASFFDVFSLAPWTFILFPGILSVRGAIGGLLSGRLGTGLHLGMVEPRYSKNTRYFYLLQQSVITLTFVSGLGISLTTWLFGLFLWGAAIADLVSILAVVIATMGLSLVFVSPVTMLVSVFSFKRGLDPDLIGYPVMSPVADILVTACYVLCLSIFFSSTSLGFFLIGMLDLVFLSLVLYMLVKNSAETEFIKTIREFLFTLVFVVLIVNITGSLLGQIRDIVGASPQIYVIYPALISSVGSMGSIVGSTATTKLALGSIEPSFPSIKYHKREIGSAWIASLLMFTSYSIISFVIYGVAAVNSFEVMITRLLITNALAIPVMVVISYIVTISTYKKGWDPDNFVIPIESSVADSITTVALLIALLMIE
ncbi:hypothetical protein GWN63_04770 [Candidatus Bathyarchaeota archaeon]|nr:hypothetical protein [Candidatus Bathyarchaeota archaeon]NIU81538.1 hypothetical protein [Candidatus Bathyarchaeota archaeon]NIV67652.1 hypothetical protein [Candidatus Bathyarchaeota archaeon]NIW16560.1 hypothetical protein [Candidatus Bathyarchaeota archaeon]NIW34700.1 hypothetical protein [Candidatus Bathyarchaeota archaeon]